MDDDTGDRVKELAEELFNLIKRPDIYVLIVVDSDADPEGNTRTMSNLTQADVNRFLRAVTVSMSNA